MSALTVPLVFGRTTTGNWFPGDYGAMPPSGNGTIPRFHLDIRVNDKGEKVIHFPFMDISDLHLGTRHSRAKRTSHMLQHTTADEFRVGGDGIDGMHLVRKKTWNFAPWHRQVLAHIVRKAAYGRAIIIPGNHDIELRGKKLMREGREVWHRKLCGKRLYNLDIVEEDIYQDPKGRVFRHLHGDDPFDNVVFGDHKKFWYGVGDFLYTFVANADTFVQQIPGCDGISIAAKSKRVVKTIINEFMGVNKEITRTIDSDPLVDGLISGHSHMGDIIKTPKGKLLLNSGCCTEHVQAMVHDKYGTFALITWHKDRIDIQEENGHMRTLTWSQLGLDSFKSPPTLIEDEHTANADRLIRLIYRMWPPRDRQKEVKRARKTNSLPSAIPLPSVPRDRARAPAASAVAING